MAKTIHIEKLSESSYSARVTDPVTGRRIRITKSTELAVRTQVERLRSLFEDYQSGSLGARELQREVSLKVKGAPMVEELWTAHVTTLYGQHQINTSGIWRVRLAPYFEKARVYELTPEVMAQWERSEVAKGAAPKTIQNAFFELKAALRAGIPHRIQELPWRTWRPRPPPRGEEQEARESCRSMAEIKDLINAAVQYDQDVVARRGYSDAATRILFLVFSGCRQSEAAALGWDHVMFDAQPKPELRIWYATAPAWQRKHPTWTRPLDPPKMNKRRTQVMHPSMVEELRLHAERLKRLGWYRPDGPVFPGERGEWRKLPRVLEGPVFRQIVELAGLPNVEKWVVHSTRHSFGTMEAFGAMLTTGDVRGAMIRGGWSKVETMMGYMKKAGRGRPDSFVPELPQEDLPGLMLGPGPAEMRRLRAAAEANEEELTKIARASVVREQSATERSMSLVELAQKYPDELPRVVEARAKARYRKAYNQAIRDGKGVERAKEEGNRALRGFRGSFMGLQKKHKESAK